MHRRRLHIHKTARGRLETSIGIGLAVITCMAVVVHGAPALAASPSVSALRRAFAQTLLAVRVTGNAAVCASTTSEGQIALIEMLRGGLYLPTTTCSEAFAGHAAAEVQSSLDCHLPAPTVSEFGPVVKKAVIHVRGDHGTVQIVYDFLCSDGEDLLTASAAVARDPMGTSHWIRKRGRWVFANRPTGTYRPAARKAVALLRAALNGRTVTVTEQPLPELIVGFCANGISHSTFLGKEGPDPQPWYVTSGYSHYSVFPYQPTPPFDTQGNPQGEILLIQAAIFSGVEWGVKLVGGTPIVTEPSGTSLPVSAPGAAGC